MLFNPFPSMTSFLAFPYWRYLPPLPSTCPLPPAPSPTVCPHPNLALVSSYRQSQLLCTGAQYYVIQAQSSHLLCVLPWQIYLGMAGRLHRGVVCN